MELTPLTFTVVLIMAFLCQYLSVSLGVGYGTVMTPLLLIIGFTPLHVVPAVLLSQLIGGIIGGVSHYRVGNIQLDFRRDDKLAKGQLRRFGYLPRSADSKVIFALTIFGIIGVLVGVLTAVNIPQIALETYIGVLVLAMGLIIVLKWSYRSSSSWRGLIALGLISAFNKGISGAGYVPLVTGGQIFGGRSVRSSVGNTTVTVAIVCAVGFISYLIVKGDMLWVLAIAMIIGSIIAAPLAAITVKKVDAEKLRSIIGYAIVLLGALLLTKAYIV